MRYIQTDGGGRWGCAGHRGLPLPSSEHLLDCSVAENCVIQIIALSYGAWRCRMIEFHRFWKELSKAEKDSLASRADTTADYLRLIANGHRNAGRATVKKLVAADDNLSLEMFF